MKKNLIFFVLMRRNMTPLDNTPCLRGNFRKAKMTSYPKLIFNSYKVLLSMKHWI